MKEISLTKGQVALVDDEDFERLNQYKWRVSEYGYAFRMVQVDGKNKREFMHRRILSAPEGKIVDHVNHNKLDNTRQNLRLCINKENMRNQKVRGGTSRFKGVVFSKERKRWEAKIMVDYKTIHLGRFMTELDAAKAYNEAAVKHFGEFALLNEFTKEEINAPAIITPVKKFSSDFKGVVWYKAGKKWTCGVTLNRKRIHVGYFDSELEAAKAYNIKALEIFGQQAKLNQV